MPKEVGVAGEAELARYLSPDEVCSLIPGMTRSALAQLRFTGRGPQYRKPTPKTVLYVEAEVRAWVEQSARFGTSDAALVTRR